MIIELEIVDDRYAGIKFGQKQRRAEAAVPHDQVRPQVSVRLARLEYAVAMPGGVFKCPTAVVSRIAGTAGCRVFHLADAVDHAAWCFRDKRTRPSPRADQMPGDMAELRGVVLVDEQNVHLFLVRGQLSDVLRARERARVRRSCSLCLSIPRVACLRHVEGIQFKSAHQA